MISMQAVGAAGRLAGEAVAPASRGVEGISVAADAVSGADGVMGGAGYAADSLAGFGTGIPTDTLQAGAEKIFGPFSELLGQVYEVNSSITPDTLISDNIVFKLVVLLCFGIYCVSLYSYRGQALTVLNIFRSKLYADNLLGEHNYTFNTFLNIVIFQGVLGISLIAVKAMDIFYAWEIVSALPSWGTVLLVPAVIAVFGIAFLYQSLALVSAGALTHNQKFISRLRYLRKINFALFSLLFTPLLLMTAMAPMATILSLVLVLAVGLAFIVVFHMARIYLMFVDENISKLYWFLYFCAIEIFPVTFLVLFFGKFFA